MGTTDSPTVDVLVLSLIRVGGSLEFDDSLLVIEKLSGALEVVQSLSLFFFV